MAVLVLDANDNFQNAQNLIAGAQQAGQQGITQVMLGNTPVNPMSITSLSTAFGDLPISIIPKVAAAAPTSIASTFPDLTVVQNAANEATKQAATTTSGNTTPNTGSPVTGSATTITGNTTGDKINTSGILNITSPPVGTPPPVVTPPPVSGLTSDQLTAALNANQSASTKAYTDALASNQTALTKQNEDFLKNWQTSADTLKSDILSGVDTKNQAFGTQATQGFMDAFKNFQIPTNQQSGVNLGNYNDNRNAAADQWWSQYVTGRR